MQRYFWGAQVLSEKPNRLEQVLNIFCGKSNPHRIHDSITFPEFLAGGILHKDCKNVSQRPPPKIWFPSLRQFSSIPLDQAGMHMSFMLESIKPSRVISCHQVRPRQDALNVLLSPFDLSGWILIITSFSVTAGLFALISQKATSTSIFFMYRVCLENSDELKFEGKHNTSFRMIVTVWLLFIGTVLTNWYKSAFTMDMILPTKYTKPWHGITDLTDFKFIMPLFDGPYDGFEDNSSTKRWDLTTFYHPLEGKLGLLADYHGNSSRLVGYKKFALDLMRGIPNMWFPDMDEGLIRVRPISYQESDTFLRNMSNCGKLGYIDTQESIEAILPFMNDNVNLAVFLKTEDGPFTQTWGWLSVKVRENDPFKKLGVMQSSGIYKHWVDWFKIVRPKKLFHHYKEWKSPVVEREARPDLNSKILLGFYVWAGSVIISVFIILTEVIVMWC